jgi:hypothetical protein
MKTEISKSKGLPKFETTGWLSIGIFFSLLLFIFSLWSMLSLFEEPFFPAKFGDILGIIVGLGLGIHCIDMIAYHRKYRHPCSNNATCSKETGSR